MSCDCYGTIKDKLVDLIAKGAPSGHGPIDIQIEGYLFSMGAV